MKHGDHTLLTYDQINLSNREQNIVLQYENIIKTNLKRNEKKRYNGFNWLKVRSSG
jgi:hypothetical protein